MSRAESVYRYKLRYTFANFEMSAGRWYLISDPNIDKLLRYRPLDVMRDELIRTALRKWLGNL
jgi:hypothetical protein